MNLCGMFVKACMLQVVQILKLNTSDMRSLVSFKGKWKRLIWLHSLSGVTRQHFTGAAVSSRKVCVCGSQNPDKVI